jgi:hypothetical protein
MIASHRVAWLSAKGEGVLGPVWEDVDFFFLLLMTFGVGRREGGGYKKEYE